MRMRIRSLAAGLVLGGLCGAVLADDTDIYLDPALPVGGKPVVMFALDFRQNLSGTGCDASNCNTLIAEGYLSGKASPSQYDKFDVLRAILKKVLSQVDGVRVGFMMTHEADASCAVPGPAGPAQTNCSNGGFIAHGAGDVDDPAHFAALFAKLDSLPTPRNNNTAHFTQLRETFFEFYRYLTAQTVVNAHNSGNDKTGNPPLTSDLNIQDGPGGAYVSPILSECTKSFTVTITDAKINKDSETDALIAQSVAAGGLGLVNPGSGADGVTQIVEYLKDADLADGNHGTLPDYPNKQNVLSYFFASSSGLSDADEWARAGGTANAFNLDADPDDVVDYLSNIFKSIVSVSTTFVAPSVPVNVFNRSQTVNEVFLALFETEENGLPRWTGNLKKVVIGKNASGESELQDVNGDNAIDVDGRLKRQALTFWTNAATLPPPVDDEVAGADGRAIARGGAGQNIPGFVSGGPQALNSAAGARQLFTEDAGAANGLMPLDADATTAAALWSEITQAWNPAASSGSYATATVAEQQKALNILRFARGLENDGTTTRDWLMVDPLHSRPNPINYGARAAGFDADNPDIRIVMGTNDGYLRMFRNTDSAGAEDGEETWAFMPREVVPVLDRLYTNLADNPKHPTTVDGSPVVYTLDVNQDGNLKSGDGDKVIVYFGLRRGGKSYYALDVSNPDAPEVLWSITKGAAGTDFAELSQSWSTPQVGRVKVDNDVIPVLVFGGGYDGNDAGDDTGDLGKDAKNRATRAAVAPVPGTDDDEGNALFIVNALDGTLVWKATQGALGYSAPAKAFRHPDLNDSVPADVAAVDTSGNGLFDRLYFGDTGGVLWRVDLAGPFDHDGDGGTPDIVVNNKPSAWTATKILSVGRHVAGHNTIADDRRFFNRPDVAQSKDDTGPFDAVLIGSGDREDPNGEDVDNYFYMVKDRAITSGQPPATLLEHGVVGSDVADLTDNCLQDGSCSVPAELANGWRIRLETSGEKNLASAVTAGGNVFFTTFAPTPAVIACGLSEGEGYLYAVSLADATAVFNFNTANDQTGVTYERSDRLGSGGIPVEVVPLGGGQILVQGQEAGENIMDIGGRTSFKTYWHALTD